jgi:pseudouridine-5'-phosphate glycosidase/pseudouridine kinase
MSTGALFGVPIPMEYEAVGEELQASVEQAVQEAEENGMSRRGKEATPWLLKRVGELTKGKSLLSSKTSSCTRLCCILTSAQMSL